MNTLIKYWSYLIENEDKEISFETYILSEDKKTYIQKHQNEEDFDKEILDKYWNEIRSRIKGKPEADIDKFWMSKPFKDLALFVNNFDNRNQKERKTDKNKEDAIKAGAHYLGDMKAENGITYEIWIPTSHKSANILRNIYKGGNDIGTAWCITVAGNDSYWDDYISMGNNFVFLINKEPILSKTDYKIDDKVAVQIEPNNDITLWDMNDDDKTLNIDNFESIIDFALERGIKDIIFPNKYDKYEKITIGGKTIRITGSSIDCSNRNLTSLKGSPKEFGGDFDCRYNKLTSLEGAPEKVGGVFECDGNELTSLKGAPKKVGKDFGCEDNKLTSLEGAPREVGGTFWCSNNKLTSLIGAPEKVRYGCSCTHNPDLPQYKIDAYEAYLNLSDSEKAPLTKDNHYYPTEEWENKFK